jgi:hypothetical protein
MIIVEPVAAPHDRIAPSAAATFMATSARLH